MSNAKMNQTGFAGSDVGEGGYGCQANDLKGLLNAIVNQISDADRRHSDTLHQLQDRLSSLGRDARSLRSRVPDQFQTAFERIEAGMAELAARIAEAEAHQGEPIRTPGDDFAPMRHGGLEPVQEISVPAAAASPAFVSEANSAEEAPMALRSASSALSASQRVPKAGPVVDTFDVIESLPGDVTDPWDRDAANALASVYEGEPRTFPQDPYAAQIPETPRIYQPAPAAGATGGPSVDHGWLEKRFAEISERIEASLSDIRPDQSFFALGQRIDQFERSFAQALDNVATRQDVESVRLIEAHMVELVTHLENTQNQLQRFDVIEDQLGAIAQRLNEVHEIAQSAGDAGPAEPAPQIDIEAVARAAAHEAAAQAASRFAAQPQAPAHVPGIDDMRRLMEQSMSSARQSEENTTALLDTLQQAMIRLLDRMDAIEFNQHQAVQRAPAASVHHMAAPSVPEYEPAPAPRVSGPLYPSRDQDDVIEEAVAAVASKSPSSRPAPAAAPATAPEQPSDHLRREQHAPAQSAAEPRSSEKLRQDFIADARRAKMRLSGEDGDAIVLPSPVVREAPATAQPGAKAGAPKPKPAMTTAMPPEPKQSAVSPRVVALSVALALAGAAYMMLPLNKRTSAPAPVATTAAEPAPSAAPAPNETQITQQAQPAPAAGGADAPPPEADFSKPANGNPPAQFNLHQTEGRIVPDDEGAARPLHGIAVTGSNNVSFEQVSRAQRDHAMASVSSRLGEVAATNPAVVAPAAIDMNSAEAAQAPAVTPQRQAALELPPATVGPLSLRLAAANGDPSAQFEVGARLAEGKGTDQNFKDAAKWYQRSASQGFAQAQYRLGTLYERGLGLKADEARAKEWYLRAAEQGNMKAMHNLAVLSANSKSGSPDYATAAKWFSDAAQRGLADSQFNLAVLYENGLGLDPDMRQAYKWLSLAARGGDKEAARRRDLMKGKLSAADLGEAEAMVRDFQARRSDTLVNDARAAGEAWKRNPANGENG